MRAEGDVGTTRFTGTQAGPGKAHVNLYTWAAVGAALLVFVGFSRTYYLKALFGTPVLPLLLHLHGLVLTLWFVCFVVQVRLVALRRVDLHRRFGVFAGIVALLVAVVSSAVAFHASRRGLLADPASTRLLLGFAILCCFLVNFSLFVGSALYFRRRPDIHKRLMLLASCSILGPAVSRIPLHFIETGDFWTIFALFDLCALVCVAYDTLKNRRLHRAFGWGVAFLSISFPLAYFIGRSNPWIHLAKWFLSR
jgi:hypothetical protein